MRPRPWDALIRLGARVRRLEPPASSASASAEPLDLDAFLRELELLHLDGRYFDWEEYRARLAAYLDIQIHVSFVPDDADAVLRMMLAQGGWPGCVCRQEKTADALVLVSSCLDDFATRLVVFHELAHVAGGHPLRYDNLLATDAQYTNAAEGWWDPPPGLSGRVAPRDEAWCEQDANRRAEFAILAGLYGFDRYRRDEWFFGVGAN